LQAELRVEIREAVKANGGLNMKAMQAMPLVESTVYEVMRFKPAVPYQYARAKEDFILESHDAAYRIKKGELLGGVAPFVLRDPAIFKDPATFNPRRFMGKEGKELLHYHIWSNGRQNEDSSVNSKQCAAKDLVPFIGRLLLAELLIKYDSFSLADKPSGSFSALSPATS
jgi:hydroperoxide dehydratase